MNIKRIFLLALTSLVLSLHCCSCEPIENYELMITLNDLSVTCETLLKNITEILSKKIFVPKEYLKNKLEYYEITVSKIWNFEFKAIKYSNKKFSNKQEYIQKAMSNLNTLNTLIDNIIDDINKFNIQSCFSKDICNRSCHKSTCSDIRCIFCKLNSKLPDKSINLYSQLKELFKLKPLSKKNKVIENLRHNKSEFYQITIFLVDSYYQQIVYLQEIL